jgi:hypothetical protein
MKFADFLRLYPLRAKHHVVSGGRSFCRGWGTNNGGNGLGLQEKSLLQRAARSVGVLF